jgi:hypothetical protein
VNTKMELSLKIMRPSASSCEFSLYVGTLATEYTPTDSECKMAAKIRLCFQYILWSIVLILFDCFQQHATNDLRCN